MKENGIDYIEKNSGKQFDEKYAVILSELKKMPKETAEDKECRFRWMKSQEEYDQFIIDSMNGWKPNAYENLRKRLNKNVGTTINPNAGVATTKMRERDPLVFMEAVADSIKNYTGVNEEGGVYTFLQCVGMNYKQIVQIEAGINDMNDGGAISGGGSVRGKCSIVKLARKVLELKEKTHGERTVEELIEDCKSEFSHKFSKIEMKEVFRRVNGLNVMVSLDYQLSEDDEQGSSLLDTIKDEHNAYEEFDSMMRKEEFLECMTKDFSPKWKDIVESTSKVNRELIKAFLSKDILIALKLEALSESERKVYKSKIEPRCGQWCPRKTRCIYNSKKNRDKGCFMRYGERSGAIENGDSDVYGILQSAPEVFYDTILKNEYVSFAYCDKVNGIYDLYSKRLKQFDGNNELEVFQFTDAVLGKALGEDTTKISKYRKKYEKVTRAELYDIFSK